MVLALVAVTLGCRESEPDLAADPEPGIALALADERARTIQNVRYSLSFDITARPSDPVFGHATIRFAAKEAARPLVLDFAPGAEHLASVTVGGRPSRFRTVNGHIIVPAADLSTGENTIEIAFRAGDAALNRNPEFVYTLFVPARAHLTFPCFDQPDLKARVTLGLTVPSGWQAVANGAETSRELRGNRLHVRYAETQPIPTYLFAFAAGQFQVETAERAGRTYRMFHRETDAAKVARNREAVFDLHASALAWMEQYTASAYRFGKFDFVLIPSFQFTGMEHPGAVYYNAQSLLLDESATENQMLTRASVISHETAHMWFGDLVTMRWFNDVWMKEVFANFMAAKLVNPAFPKVNHELRFLVAHYPGAYAVDRTAGTHAIRQELANLNEAGSLYGPIIYQKAPIVMRQLERLIGPDRMRDGLRVYLKRFELGNATWRDLIGILDERSDLDLAAWSRAWVEEAGRPVIRTVVEADPRRPTPGYTGRVTRLSFVQADLQPGRSLRWTQQMELLVGTPAGARSIPVDLRDERVDVVLPASLTLPSPFEGEGRVRAFVLPAGGGLAYGGFWLDDGSRDVLLERVAELADPVARGATWITLWDEMLEGRIRPAAFLNAALGALPQEDTEQNVQLVTGYVDEAFWRFLPAAAREAFAPRLEQRLRDSLKRASLSTMKSTYFSAFRSVVTTADGLRFLERVWRRVEKVPGLTLAEPDEATMALELAVRSVPGAPAILEEQRARFTNADRKARFEFVMPAVSDRPETREAFFRSLDDAQNRRREPWVLEGLQYLHHPLRATDSLQYVRPALELLPEIRRTGDIFFPERWANATLGGHNSREAADVVRRFLADVTDLPIRLRRIVLQAADDLFRAAAMHDRSGRL